MIEEIHEEFQGRFETDHATVPMLFSLRHVVLDQCELIGTCDQDPAMPSLALGAVGNAVGMLRNGCSITAKRAVLLGKRPRPSGGVRCIFAAESVTIERNAGPFGKAWFSPGTQCEYRWLLTGSQWLDTWIAFHEHEKDRCITLPGGPHTANLGCQDKQESVPASPYGHVGKQVFSVPKLTLMVDASGKTFDDLKQSIPRNGILHLCACLSCLSQAKVDWIEEAIYVRHPDESGPVEPACQEIRRFRLTEPKSVIDACILPPRIPAKVVGKATENLQAKGENMIRAVQFYVSSFVLEAEQEFVALTTALEALKEAHLAARDQTGILSKVDFAAIVAEVEVTIKRQVEQRNVEANKADLIVGKLPELNRPAYASVVREMCADLCVDHGKIYPGGFSFIPIRNDMIHQGRVPDPHALRHETVLLRQLVECILRKMLT